ncbi:MAG: 16S rRNA (guanine(527)-N(7))-methyltransferase RsmG [Chloroflexi bacterium]|nr:16S rRNA (guanine(527)-N(7))-methyltransferase RsmG [Chloroflexota bacterium]
MQRLADGARALGITLSPQQLDAFRLYRDELLEWNQRFNLTAITDPLEVETKHFLDSLTLVPAVPDGLGAHSPLVDVGAGAGFPGLVIKIACPDLSLTLIEATGKKARFLEHIVARLSLRDVHIVARRAEEAAHDPSLREAFHLVAARALAPMPVLAELTLPFCAVGGLVVAHKRGDISEELRQAERAIRTLGGRLREVKPVAVPGLEDERSLVVLEKIAPTPAAYPRRPGIPTKRPLV